MRDPPTEKETKRSSSTGGRSNEEKDPRSTGRRALDDIADAKSLSRAADVAGRATSDASDVEGERVGDHNKIDHQVLELVTLNQALNHQSKQADEIASTTPRSTATRATAIAMSGCRNMHDPVRVVGITTVFDELVGPRSSTTGIEDSETTNASLLVSTCYRARRWLFVSHALAQFSEIAWQFTVTIVLAAHTNYQSLRYVSTYGLSVSLAVCVGVTPLGRCIDAAAHRPHGRLQLARWLLGLENVIVLVGTLCCYNLLGGLVGSSSNQPERNPTEALGSTSSLDASNGTSVNTAHDTLTDPDKNWSMMWIVLIHVLGSWAQILDQAFLVAMERDWIVVLSQSAADASSSMAKADPTAVSSTPAEAVAVPQTDPCSPESHNVQIHRTRDPSVLSMWLSDTNVGMKQIDLLCKVAAPTVIGWLLPDQGVVAAAATTTTDQPPGPNRSALQYLCVGVGLLNVCALVAEYVCTAQVYQWIPALGRASSDPRSTATYQPLEQTDRTTGPSLPADDDDNYDGRDEPTETRSPSSSPPPIQASNWACWSEWLIYWHQPIAGAGLALALLYVNPLTFGNGILTAYLLSRGMDMSWIGIWRGVAAAIGLLGTCVFHWAMRHHYALHTTAFSSVVFQVACLGACLVSLAVASVNQRSVLSLVLLIGGVCCSRIGLWAFDIAVTQMQQEEIPDHVRGRVGGVQQALNSFFRLLSFVSTLLYPNPSEFYISVTAGFSGVAVAALSFGVGVFWPRHTNYVSGRQLPVDQDEEGSAEFVG